MCIQLLIVVMLLYALANHTDLLHCVCVCVCVCVLCVVCVCVCSNCMCAMDIYTCISFLVHLYVLFDLIFQYIGLDQFWHMQI